MILITLLLFSRSMLRSGSQAHVRDAGDSFQAGCDRYHSGIPDDILSKKFGAFGVAGDVQFHWVGCEVGAHKGWWA